MASSARIDELRKKFDENPRRYFAPLANEYRKAGDFAQAIAICRQHLTDQPGHMSGHIVFGQALFENKDFAEARTIFEAALALDPENLIALRHLGDIARDDADYTAARTWYQRVLDADPRNEDIAAQLALVAEAEANAASAAAAAAAAAPPPRATPASALPSTIVTSAVKRESVIAEAKTLEIAAVSRPSQPAVPAQVADVVVPVFETPLALAPERVEDATPPRLSLMGLDLESMAGVEETPEPGSAGGAGSALGFVSGHFDGDSDAESDPLAGVSGVAQNEENTAAGLVAREPVKSDFELGAGYRPESTPASAEMEAELPAELVVPSRNTPPLIDLGLPPQPKVERSGLWDTPDDEAASAAAHAELEHAELAIDPSFAPPPAVPAASVAPLELETIELTEHDPAAGRGASGAFVTETMAELYVKQGFPEQAIDVYRQLIGLHPDDAALRERLSSLQASLAHAAPARGGPSVREFLAALARWQPGQGNGAHAVESTTHLEPVLAPDVAPDVAPDLALDLAPIATVAEPAAPGGYDLGIFAGATIADADENAAHMMAQLYPEPLVAGNGGAHAPAEAAVSTAVAEPLPGNPARPASSELSLDQVFTESAPSRPSRRSSASFSFDQFFSQATSGTPPRSATPAVPMTPVAPAVQSPEEIEQFQSWLGGLKKK